MPMWARSFAIALVVAGCGREAGAPAATRVGDSATPPPSLTPAQPALATTAVSRPHATPPSLTQPRIDLARREGWYAIGTTMKLMLRNVELGASLDAVPFDHEPSVDDLRALVKGTGFPEPEIELGSGTPRRFERRQRDSGFVDLYGWLATLRCDDQWVVLVYIDLHEHSPGEAIVAGAKCLPRGTEDPWPHH